MESLVSIYVRTTQWTHWRNEAERATIGFDTTMHWILMIPLMAFGFALAVVPVLVGMMHDRKSFSEATYRETARTVDASDDHARLVVAAQRS